jgi:hypothetical protein
MGKTIRVVYDGESLRPLDPLELEVDRSYLVRIEEVPRVPGAGDAWAALRALAGTVDAPADWAAEHDHYLYGSPKRNARDPA